VILTTGGSEQLTDFLYDYVALTTMMLFAVSALSKATAFRSFKAAIRSFSLVRPAAVTPLAVAVLSSEVLVVLLLMAGGAAAVGGFILAICSLLVYTAAISTVLIRRQAVICNCFGPSDRAVSPWDVSRNVLLIGLCVTGLPLGDALQWQLSMTLEYLLLGGGLAAVSTVLIINLRDVGRVIVRGI